MKYMKVLAVALVVISATLIFIKLTNGNVGLVGAADNLPLFDIVTYATGVLGLIGLLVSTFLGLRKDGREKLGVTKQKLEIDKLRLEIKKLEKELAKNDD